MLTVYRHIPVLSPAVDLETILPAAPGLDKLRAVLAPFFDEPFEHVAVLFEGERRDMFVGETSTVNGRHIRNIRGTAIYRANALAQYPGTDPETLPAISGPVVLFPGRRVWF